MTKKVDIILPEASQEGTESVIASWLKKIGDNVGLHEPILEISTDKVNVEVPSPASGVLIEILKHENEQINPGDVLGQIQLVGEVPQQESPQSIDSTTEVPLDSKPAQPVFDDAVQETKLSPSVRRLVKQYELDVNQIHGTGRGGRISYTDVENYLKSFPVDQPRETSIEQQTNKRIPHTPMRLSIARHMVESMLKTAPHVTAIFDADMSAVISHRENHKGEFQRDGVKLTYTAYFVKAVVNALHAVPEVNSRWHDNGLELIADCNIGVATAVEGGLIVPVLHQAQNLDLLGIGKILQDLTNRARNNKLEQHEVQNDTLTITNHGVSGSLIATPIINQPQSAILGIGKLEKRVVVSEVNGTDSIQIKPMIYVTLTIDHRSLDGFQANTFLSKFVEVLENWV